MKFKVEKNVFFMGLTSLLADVSSEMIYPLLPVFLASVLGVSKGFIGLIEGVAESTASILKLFSGYLSDKINQRKPIVLWGYSLSAVSKPLLVLSQTGFGVLILRFFDRAGKGIRTAPRDALISDSSPGGEVGKSFGFHRAMDTVGAVLGPLLAFLLLPAFGYRGIFLLSAIPAVASVAALAFFVTEKKRSSEGKAPRINIELLKELSPKFLLFVFIMTLFTIGNSSNVFLIIRAQGVGVPVILIPILYLFFNVVYSLFATPSGMLSDVIGRKKVIFFGLLLYSLTYFGFGFASNATHIWVLFAVYGIYYGLTEGTAGAFVSDLTPSSIRATAYGVYHMMVGLALLPASIILGVLWQMFGATVAFSFGGVLAGIAAILLLLLI
ncbi:MAG: MFS transporter [Candidatus Saganbacteria bacterium]|nr:MFS transporter [Candidatus Saganbacteria bacterium]